MKKDGIDEDDSIFIPTDIVKRANEDTIPLLEKLEYIEHNCVTWKAKLTFVRAIQSKERRFYALDVHCLEVFDDELLAIFTKEYKEANNAQKRDMSHYLLNLDFIYEVGFRNENTEVMVNSTSDDCHHHWFNHPPKKHKPKPHPKHHPHKKGPKHNKWWWHK